MKQTSYRLGTLILLALALAATPLPAQVASHHDLEYPELPDFEVPRPEVFELANGLTIFLMEDHELPLITVTARVRTGSYYMPAGKKGMGDIFGQVQREGGTASMTGDEIDDFLEARAASVETYMGGESAGASMNCLVEHFDEVFAVFHDVLRHPTFAEEKIELAGIQLNTSIARRNDSVSGIVGREFRRLIYGTDSPLASLNEYATVAAVTREDLRAWHAAHYHPNRIDLGVVGDFDAKAMKGKIKAALESWPEGPGFDGAEVPYRKETAPGIYFIEKSDVTQAHIRSGHLGIRRDDPDYFAVQVLNEVLGGGFSGRLMKHIRSEKGLSYGVFGGVGASFLRPGIFQVGMSTKSSSMAESVRALREEVTGIIEQPPTEVEMRQAKESILNSFVFNYTSRSQILGQQMTFAYYGLPTDYLERYRDNIEKVKAEEVARAAKKLIHPDRMALLVVGKSEEFDEPVSAFGKVSTLDITIPPPPDTRPEVPKTEAGMETGRELVARMAHRVLGDGKPPIRSIRARTTTEVDMGGQSMSLVQETSIQMPDKIRQSVQTPMGEVVVVINGNRGIRSSGGQSVPIPDEMIENGLRDLARHLGILASHASSPDLEAVAAGADEVDSAACDLVSVTFRGVESRLCIDGDGTVMTQSYQGNHPMMGNPGLMETRFSDYGEFNGYRLPRRQVLHFDGEAMATTTVESMEINPELEAASFEIPEAE